MTPPKYVDRLRAYEPRTIGATILGCAAGFALTYGLLVLTARGQEVDERLYLLILRAEPTLGPSAEFVRRWAPDVSAIIALLVGVVALVRWSWRALLGGVLGVVLSVAGAIALREALLPRPMHGVSVGGIDALDVVNTFPSGHVTAVASLWLAVLVLWPGRNARLPFVVGTAMVVLIAVASVVAHAHRPSDVIGAPFLTLAICGAVYWAVRVPLPMLGVQAPAEAVREK